MKAIIAQGHGQLTMAEVPMPKPKDYQCLCKILACPTCSGTDRRIVAVRSRGLKPTRHFRARKRGASCAGRPLCAAHW